jgi:hypothetical protein
MKPGDLAECAIWITGEETETMLRQWKVDCAYLMAQQQEPKLKLGPVSFEIKRPGDDRVPQVPHHLSGPDVRLLVATAEVLGFETTKRESFVDQLDKSDLKRLRLITRAQHGKKLTDVQCDQIIDRLGPGVAAQTVRSGMVH